MHNRISDMFPEPFDPTRPEQEDTMDLPEDYDPRRVPPPEPNAQLPLEMGIGRQDLLRLIDENLYRLQVLAPTAKDAPDPEAAHASFVASEHTLRCFRTWVAAHPGAIILMSLFPSNELEPVEDDE